jgi:hydrogenase nickel incorporation protein HypB
LVCPAEFDLGEDFKTAVLSTPEGADKPLKYPMLFVSSKAIILTKTDLLPYVRFDMQMFRSDLSSINPVISIFEVDLINGNGINAWLEFISKKIEEKRKEL